MDNAALSAIASDAIRAHLVAQGLMPEERNGILRLGVGDLGCRCDILPGSKDVHGAVVPVGVELTLGDTGRRLREVVVGIAENPERAVEQAMQIWCDGVFPPIHHAFAVLPDSDPRIETCRMASQAADGTRTDWTIYLGPTQVGGWNRAVTTDVFGTDTLLRSFADPLIAAAGDPRLHWIKIYLARQPTGEKRLECKLDNEDWEVGRAILDTLPLPKDSHFVHLRRFLVMQPSVSPDGGGSLKVCYPPNAVRVRGEPRTRQWWQFWKVGR